MHRDQKEYTINTKHGSYKALIWRDKKDKAYLVEAPAFPELATFGTSLANAKWMAKDIVELHRGLRSDSGPLA